LQEKWLSNREARCETLGTQLRRVETELAKRDLTTLSTRHLFTLAESLRRQIKREAGPVEFATPVSQIPADEYHEHVQDWVP
jgi:hypothetical protein